MQRINFDISVGFLVAIPIVAVLAFTAGFVARLLGL
jgi:hypothetical protein